MFLLAGGFRPVVAPGPHLLLEPIEQGVGQERKIVSFLGSRDGLREDLVGAIH